MGTVIMGADGDELTEADVVHLRSLVKPGELDLRWTCITDSAIDHVPETVEKLAIGNTGVTDAALRKVDRLPKLTHLNLANTGITDVGLQALATAKALKWLNLENTLVTNRGIRQLQEALPSVVIQH